MFKKVTVETMETRSNSVRNIDDGSHQIGSQKKRKRLEDICEEKAKQEKVRDWGRDTGYGIKF